MLSLFPGATETAHAFSESFLNDQSRNNFPLWRNSESCPVMALKKLAKIGRLAPCRFNSKTEVIAIGLALFRFSKRTETTSGLILNDWDNRSTMAETDS